VLHAGTAVGPDGAIVSAGGRVVDVVATGATLAAARRTAYEAVAMVHLERSHYRTDIALDAERGAIHPGGTA
ncbi:MAG: phosphoribosylglycinamide synthetase C domain-containing protein, partial [Lapillicoccus sp.]